MEVPVVEEGKELVKNEEFNVASITEVPASSSSSSSPVIGRFRFNNGVAELRFGEDSESNLLPHFDLRCTQASFFGFPLYSCKFYI